MSKYLPFIVTGIVILPMVVYQWILMEWVWGANTPSRQCAYLIMNEQTGIPYTLGEEDEWVGIDMPVEKAILEVAGAEGYIQRKYINQQTNDQVDVWFIVGNFRQVSKHTPNFCYRASGFDQIGSTEQFRGFEHEPTPEFSTAKFHRSTQEGIEQYTRVFWAWWRPDLLEEGQTEEDVEVVWTAPNDARKEFGPCRVLYKLYFTAPTDAAETAERSVCVEFAELFLPEVEKVLRRSGAMMAVGELPQDIETVTAPFEMTTELRERMMTEGLNALRDDKSDEAETDEATEDESADETSEVGDEAEELSTTAS